MKQLLFYLLTLGYSALSYLQNVGGFKLMDLLARVTKSGLLLPFSICFLSHINSLYLGCGSLTLSNLGRLRRLSQAKH